MFTGTYRAHVSRNKERLVKITKIYVPNGSLNAFKLVMFTTIVSNIGEDL